MSLGTNEDTENGDDFVYLPSEDTYLMLNCIKKIISENTSNKLFDNTLEIGCGSGILSQEIAKHSKNHIAVDINPNAIEETKRRLGSSKESNSCKYNVTLSNLFEKVPRINTSDNSKIKYDLIVFNPPYLPAHKNDRNDWETKALVGGKNGYELLNKFLEEVISFLATEGKILILFTTLTKPVKVYEKIDEVLLDKKEIGKNQIMGEEIFVYELTKSQPLLEIDKSGITDIKFVAKGNRGVFLSGILPDSNSDSNLKISYANHENTNFFKYKTVPGRVGIKSLLNLAAGHSILKEINNLKYVNRFGVGPKFYFSGEDYMVCDFIDGERIEDFCINAPVSEIKEVLIKSFDQCKLMDDHNFEKKEMVNPYKHILVTRAESGLEICFIDFERGVIKESAGNVSQFIEYLISSGLSRLLLTKGIDFSQDKENLRKIVSKYKKAETPKLKDEVYSQIIDIIKAKM